MTVFMGWEVEIEMPVFVEDTDTGDGTTTEFDLTTVQGTSEDIVDINGDETVTDSDVKVYIDDVLQTPTTDYAVNLTTEIVTFVSAPDSPAVIRFKYAYGPMIVSRSQSVSIESSKTTEEIPILGESAPFVKSGRQSISGSLESLITGRQFFEAAGADQVFTPKFTMKLKVGSPAEEIELKGVSVETWSPEFPRDDIAPQTVDFKATTIRWL